MVSEALGAIAIVALLSRFDLILYLVARLLLTVR